MHLYDYAATVYVTDYVTHCDLLRGVTIQVSESSRPTVGSNLLLRLRKHLGCANAYLSV